MAVVIYIIVGTHIRKHVRKLATLRYLFYVNVNIRNNGSSRSSSSSSSSSSSRRRRRRRRRRRIVVEVVTVVVAVILITIVIVVVILVVVVVIVVVVVVILLLYYSVSRHCDIASSVGASKHRYGCRSKWKCAQGTSIAKYAANSRAAVSRRPILLSNRASACRTDVGGPASSIRQGGGRRRRRSDIRVTRENMTHKFNHQSSSEVPSLPWGGIRPQSTITPVRNVCPCEAVAVRWSWPSYVLCHNRRDPHIPWPSYVLCH